MQFRLLKMSWEPLSDRRRFSDHCSAVYERIYENKEKRNRGSDSGMDQ